MKLLSITPPLLTLLLTTFSMADTATMTPGEYLAERGRGHLLVVARKKGQYFKINGYGANGHSCFAEGISESNTNTQEDMGQGTPCKITFAPKADLIQVSTTDGCQAMCGARATINHEYFKTDDICLDKNKNLKIFISYYSKKAYDLAEKTLRKAYNSCKKYMSFFEEIDVVNDLAVTYKNLNKKDDCLNLIKPFNELADMSESDIKEDYPPGDVDLVLPLANRLKFNRELCRGLK